MESCRVFEDDVLLVEHAACLVADLFVDSQKVGNQLASRLPDLSGLGVAVAPISPTGTAIVVVVVLGGDGTSTNRASVLPRLGNKSNAIGLCQCQLVDLISKLSGKIQESERLLGLGLLWLAGREFCLLLGRGLSFLLEGVS